MEKQTNIIDLRRFKQAFLRCKWLCLAIIVVFTGVGFWWASRSMTDYTIQGEMLIGEMDNDTGNKGGGLSQMMKTFSVGGFGGSSVDNEVLIVQSHDVLMRTIRALDLNRSYTAKDESGDKVMLYHDTPVKLEAPAEYFDTLATSFNVKIKLLGNDKVDVNVTQGIFGRSKKRINGVTIPSIIETPFGAFQITATDAYANTPYKEVTVTVCGNDKYAQVMSKDLTISVESKLADVIMVEYKCPNAEKGKAVVDGIMGEYNAKRLDRLHESSIASINYYDERIAEAFADLQNIEQSVADYQRKNDLMGIDSELGLLVETAVGNKQNIMTANYNLAYYETVLDILRKRLGDDVLIPQVETLDDPNVTALNALIAERRNLRRSATDDNEAIQILNKKIEELRDLVIENSEKMVVKSRADISHQQALTNNAQSRLDEYPDFELEFQNMLRDKAYKNQLYEYLVGQRENSVLQLYSKTNLGFVFQPAFVASSEGILSKCTKPAAFFVASLLVCLFICVVVLLFSKKIKTPVDLAFIGLDNQTTTCDDNKGSYNVMRTAITARPDSKILYFAPLGGSDVAMNMFVESLISIGRNVEVMEPQGGNDELLTPDFQALITQSLSSADYAIVKVPQPDCVADIINVVDAPDALLMMSLPANKINRSQYKKILKGQDASKVFTLIVK